MKYVEETVEEVQPDGSIMLRRVIIPVRDRVPQDDYDPVYRVPITIEIWGDRIVD